jgi:CDP-diacylglycerol--glycerol-3-phosphate 3-phosphatidyltransferase
MPRPELLLIPNLLSLSRVLLTPVIGYFLWRNDPFSTAICLLLLVVAGITDALDGYYARRLKLTSKLGLILDPLADKIFAAVLIGELILFRNFPVWLAAAIIGRDLLIGCVGLAILGRRRITMASNLTGKYTFFSIVVLIGFSILSFESGVKFVAIITLLLLAGSLINYARAMIRLLHGVEPRVFHDRPLFQALRIGTTAVLLAICVVFFVMEKILGKYPLLW